jgi:Glycosyltransferase Family 4
LGIGLRAVTTRRKRIVVLHEVANPAWRWVSHQVPEVDWQFVYAPAASGTVANRIGRLGAALRASHAGRNADLVISFGAGLGGALELGRRMLRVKTPHVCYYLNFDHLPDGLRRERQARLFKSIDRFVVSASVERDLYARHFGIDPARIDVILWGVNAPVASEMEPPYSDYVCAVGGNARAPICRSSSSPGRRTLLR